MATSMILGKLTLTGNFVSYACKKTKKTTTLFLTGVNSLFQITPKHLNKISVWSLITPVPTLTRPFGVVIAQVLEQVIC